MCNPSPAGKLLVKKSDDAVVGDRERDVCRVMNRRARQVLLGPRRAAVRGAAEVERVDVPVASFVGPAYVDSAAAVRVHGDRERGADAFLSQGGSVRPGNGNALRNDAA